MESEPWVTLSGGALLYWFFLFLINIYFQYEAKIESGYIWLADISTHLSLLFILIHHYILRCFYLLFCSRRVRARHRPRALTHATEFDAGGEPFLCTSFVFFKKKSYIQISGTALLPCLTSLHRDGRHRQSWNEKQRAGVQVHSAFIIRTITDACSSIIKNSFLLRKIKHRCVIS